MIWHNFTENTPYPSAPEWETVPLRLRERFSLEENDVLTILDAKDDSIFIEVYRDYPMDSPYFREVGYSSYTTRLFIYDWAKDSVIYECEVQEGDLCTDGVLLDGERWAYVVLQRQGTGSSYDVHIICENLEGGRNVVYTEPADGEAYYNIPELVSLAEGTFAFSYLRGEDPKDFGVCAVAQDLQVTKLYEPSSDARFIGTELRGNGTEFVYYVFEGGHCLLLGNNRSEIARVCLEEDERMHSFCLLGDQICAFVGSNAPADKRTDEICTWDFDGNIRISQSANPIFRLASAGGNQAVGIDMSYQTWWISDRGDSIQIQKLELPQESVMFYTMNEESVLAYFDESDTLMTLHF